MKQQEIKNKELETVLETIQTPQEKNQVMLSSQERRTIIDEKVRNMILRGNSRTSCMKFIANESKRLGFENTESHCSNIYQQVKSSLKTEIEEQRDELLTDITSKMYYLYAKNIENDDLKEARECLKEIGKLVGVGINQVNIARDKEKEVININFGFND